VEVNGWFPSTVAFCWGGWLDLRPGMNAAGN